MTADRQNHSMSAESGSAIRFKRNHFSTRLPGDRLYCLSHVWLRQDAPRHWLVGLTGFATRMLGEIVEFDFETAEGQAVKVADVIGWIEGFKAVSDVYCVAEGVFGGVNPAAVDDPEIICRDPYGDGWIYSVEGEPDPQAVDVQGYVDHLNRTIDTMLEKPWTSGEMKTP